MSESALKPAPAKLVRLDGSIPFGTYAGPVSDVNAGDFDYTGLAPLPFPLGIGGRKRRFKRWQFYGVIDRDFVFGAAVAHVQYLATGFSYLYDRKAMTIVEKNIKRPLAKGAVFSASPNRGVSEIIKGSSHIRSDNTATDRTRRLSVDFGPELSAEIVLTEPGTGISTLCPQDGQGFHYTYKSAGLPATGTVEVSGRQYTLSDAALAVFDWTASTAPRATTWNWACAVGRDENGRPIGINCSRGLVGGGYSQNTIWLNGEPTVLSAVEFTYDSQDILGKPWQVRTTDGLLDLAFQPTQERYENINLGLVASRLHQPFGAFSGRLTAGGRAFSAELFGFCEEHFAKW